MTNIAEQAQTLRASSSECIDNDRPVQVPAAMSPGDMLPQGDIGLLMLESLPSDWQQIEWPKEGDMQLAPGTTQGSRHTIPRRFKNAVLLYRITDGDQLSDLGLLARALFDLEHPEHADHVGYPAGVYRVRHQQNAQRERVID